jgi:hypothetical protein
MKSFSRFKSSLFTAALALLGFAAFPSACGGSDSGGSAGGAAVGNGGAGATDGGGSGGAVGGDGGSSASGGSGGGIIIDSGQGGGNSDGSACAAETQTADLVPLDLYIMLDKSGSMGNGTGSKWEAVTTAMQAFVNDTASAGIGVGLQYFPGSPECMDATYSTPEVPIAALPGNASAIVSSLTATVPGGQTPAKPALQGAVDYMTGWLLQNPTHAGVVVLATDGQPNDCASTVDNVASIAQAAAGDTPPILTFVIGVGTSLTNLDQIAAAGGTKKAFIVDTTGNVTQQFIDALNAIRGGAIACEYLIPKPEAGTIDPGKVNVSYTPGDGSPAETFNYVKDEASCPANGDAWYYDNPANPTKVILCPATCDKVKQDSKAEVKVAFGCKTQVA